MKTNKIKWLLLLIIPVLAVVVLLGIRAFRGSRVKADFQELLFAADYALSLGYTDRAEEELERALDLCRGEYSYLRLLKRMWTAAKISGRYHRFSQFSQKAAAKIPGSKKLRFLAAYAGLRSSDRRADQILDEVPRDINLQFLWAESQLRRGKPTVSRRELDPELVELLRMQSEHDPARLEQLGTQLNDDRILLDASLQWMRQGRPDRALRISDGFAEAYQEAAILIAYDAGMFSRAAQMLEGFVPADTPLRIVQADILRQMKDFSRAADLYQQISAADPEFSWMPYLNLAWIGEIQGDLVLARRFREQAYRLFPEREEAGLSLALDYGAKDPRAVQILEKILEQNPNSLETNLLLLDFKRPALPGQYLAALWQLFELFPDQPAVCERLVLYLLEYGDLAAAASALETSLSHIRAHEVLELKAILLSLNGRLLEALPLFQESIDVHDNWRARYNYALVLHTADFFEESIQELIQAETLLGPPPSSARERALLRTTQAEAYLESGDFAAAKRESEYALDLDLNNLRARLLLKKLEEL